MSEEKKNKDIKIRVSEKDLEMIDYICAQTGKTASEILRNGVRIQYNLEKVKE